MRSVRRTALVRGGLLVVALGLAAGLYLAIHGEPKSTGGGSTSSSPAAPVPKFAFTIGSVRPLTTGKRAHADAVARSAANNIGHTLDRLYLTGFLDPNA